MYVLDTDHLSLNLRGHAKIRERLVLIPSNEIAITIITAEEQLRGRLAQISKGANGNARSIAYAYLRKAVIDLAKLNILDYDASADNIFQGLKRNAFGSAARTCESPPLHLPIEPSWLRATEQISPTYPG